MIDHHRSAYQLDLFGLPECLEFAPGVRPPRRRAASRRRDSDAAVGQLELPFTAEENHAADDDDDAAYRRQHFGYSRDD